jgi:hypothetical protein
VRHRAAISASPARAARSADRSVELARARKPLLRRSRILMRFACSASSHCALRGALPGLCFQLARSVPALYTAREPEKEDAVEKETKAKIMVGSMMLFALGFIFAVGAGLGALLMLAYNYGIARPFGAPELSFWAAWGIWIGISFLLSAIKIMRERSARKRRLQAAQGA